MIYFTATFANPEIAIKGFRIATTDKAKMLGGGTIYTIVAGEWSKLEGVQFKVDKTKGFTYIKFVQSVKTKYLLINNWTSVDAGQQYIDFSDIEFYK